MCDTFVCPPALSKTGNWIFGKNSDREPNEIQILRQYPARENPSGEQQCSFIKAEHTRKIYSTILSQPFQMWGAEMGVNEKGVAIGNEAVFTKMPLKKKNSGLTGMDMLRLALESCATAAEAVDKLKILNEKYGQDGNGGYKSDFFYHNSFLVVDTDEAYVLETAGRFWALEKVNGFRSISNGLTIGSHYDDIHQGAIDYARKKGWMDNRKDFSFSKAFSAFWMPRLSKCKARRKVVESLAKEGFGIMDAFDVLRSHDKQNHFIPFKSSTGSVCMHATGLLSPHQTASSMVAELRKSRLHTVWSTGASLPCLSIFTPFYFDSESLTEDSMEKSRHWQRWEAWHRKAIHDYQYAHAHLDEMRNIMEEIWVRDDQTLAGRNMDHVLSLLSKDALRKSDETLQQLPEPKQVKPPLTYRMFWKGVTSKYQPA